MISFCIVNWNGGEVFKNCLQSIQKSCDEIKLADYEIIVLDNASSDLDGCDLQPFRNLRLIKNEKNLGFAIGTNQSVQSAKGNYFFILNNDILINANSLRLLINFIETEKYDAVVPQLNYPDKQLQKSITGLPVLKDIFYASTGFNYLSSRFDHWMNHQFDYSKSQEITDQPMFSALLIKKEIWAKTGDLDTQFPYLWNDVDWFFRFYEKGGRCYYLAEAKVIHYHGMSINKNRFKKVFRSTLSMYRYFDKNGKLNWIKKCCLILLCVETYCIRFVKELVKLK